MYTNVNLEAPIGALAFLATGLLLFAAALLLVYALVRHKRKRAGWIVLAAAVVLSLYLGCLLIFSLRSSEQVVARGQEKYFCEMDCHLAYSIVSVTTTKTIGGAGREATAAGLYHEITVKTRFDENTITPSRGSGPLTPNSRRIAVVDPEGKQYLPLPDSVVMVAGGVGTPITSPLRPGESYTTKLIFDLPTGIGNHTLLIAEDNPLTSFLIGHENSPLHGKTRLQL